MRSHVLRPLYLAGAFVLVLLAARIPIVPRDFGIWTNGYMYGWHRKGNEADWKSVTPKYKPKDYCKDCHSEQYTSIKASFHAPISCQNCHGPAGDHPDSPAKLPINRSRSLCLRCHYSLPYPTNARSAIPGIDPEKHNPGIECATCHNPHKPNLNMGGAR